VGRERKTTGDVCLDDKKAGVRDMKPPLMPVPELGAVLYLSAATSNLPWNAKMATLMV
jgi:hypothetical protein